MLNCGGTAEVDISTSEHNLILSLFSPRAQGSAALAGALVSNSALEVFSMNGNYAGTMGGSALAKGLEANEGLEEFNLNGNEIGSEGMRAIIAGLVAHKGKLESIDFGNNKISADCMEELAAYLKDNKTCVLPPCAILMFSEPSKCTTKRHKLDIKTIVMQRSVSKSFHLHRRRHFVNA